MTAEAQNKENSRMLGKRDPPEPTELRALSCGIRKGTLPEN